MPASSVLLRAETGDCSQCKQRGANEAGKAVRLAAAGPVYGQQ